MQPPTLKDARLVCSAIRSSLILHCHDWQLRCTYGRRTIRCILAEFHPPQHGQHAETTTLRHHYGRLCLVACLCLDGLEFSESLHQLGSIMNIHREGQKAKPNP